MSQPETQFGHELARVGPPGDEDRYILVKHLGLAGGEGEIWRAQRADDHDQIARDYAIKLLTPRKSLSGVKDLGERWMKSVEVLKAAPRPGLCHVYEGFEGLVPHEPGQRPARTTWYLVMEWVTGVNYDTYLVKNRAELRPLADAAMALDALHRDGYVHGDVKPSNIKITEEEGQPTVSKLVDISLIRQVTTEGTRFLVGTPGYMDPALATNNQYTALSDLYSFAAMLCFALVGKSEVGIGPAPSIEELRRDADQPGVRRILGALDPDLERRPQAAGYQIGHLKRWLDDVIADQPRVSSSVREAVRERSLETPVMPVVDPPTSVQRSGWRELIDQAGLQLLDTGRFVLAAAAVIVVFLVLGLIAGSVFL